MKSKLHQKYIKESVVRLPAGIGSIETAWTSPSNIALIKYWGKLPSQIPRNPSLSFSLAKAVTEMKVITQPSSGGDFNLEYIFEEKVNESFEARIWRYMETLFPYFPFLRESSVTINSHNTFPHSSGIASSASSMSALALCLCATEQKIRGGPRGNDFYQKASYISRLGSGSACRSVYGKFVSWGSIPANNSTSDEYATLLDIETGKSFQSLYDAVLIVSPQQKKVSSSEGHALMNNHPFASERYAQSRKNHENLVQALQGNDVESFIRITENEALTLHGLMMSSDPGFVLLEPASLEIISRIRRFREETKTFITFTIDAGPNVHLIYPADEREKVTDFIRTELEQFCYEGKWIDDRMGQGPVELSN